jgi:hypothetical protein
VTVDRFQARVAAEGDSSVLTWAGPDQYAVLLRGRRRAGNVSNRGLQTMGSSAGTLVLRRAFAAAPDGYTVLDLLDPSVETLLAQARAGAKPLIARRLGTRPTLRGTVGLGPNDCAGYRGGVKTVDLDAQTLLPLRIVTRRSGARTQTTRLSGLRVNPPLPGGAFRPLPLRGDVFRDDQGFRRVAPAVAARHLPYTPELPATLPSGFALALTGWAPKGATVGAEGSLSPRPGLFAAVYSRGVEQIDVTQRRSGERDWPGDPFGGECRPLTEQATTVNGLPATYAFGPETGPHLYWRAGNVLHTVSGPFPAETLVAVAQSLAPIVP